MFTKLSGKPISTLDKWQKSLLFAELSAITYEAEPSVLNKAREAGFSDALFFDHKGAQGYMFLTKYDCVVACRGTEPTEFNKLKVELKEWPTKSQTLGYVHTGFKKEADKIWKGLKTEIVNAKKTTWFTGHSLGAAMVTLCASRCQHHAPAVKIGGVFTYGSPRVGCKSFIKASKVPHTRWVNSADIVTKFPLAIMGYVHHGTIHYINTHGNVRNWTFWQRLKDKYRTMLKGRDAFLDHSINDYVKFIKQIKK